MQMKRNYYLGYIQDIIGVKKTPRNFASEAMPSANCIIDSQTHPGTLYSVRSTYAYSHLIIGNFLQGYEAETL